MEYIVILLTGLMAILDKMEKKNRTANFAIILIVILAIIKIVNKYSAENLITEIDDKVQQTIDGIFNASEQIDSLNMNIDKVVFSLRSQYELIEDEYCLIEEFSYDLSKTKESIEKTKAYYEEFNKKTKDQLELETKKMRSEEPNLMVYDVFTNIVEGEEKMSYAFKLDNTGKRTAFNFRLKHFFVLIDSSRTSVSYISDLVDTYNSPNNFDFPSDFNFEIENQTVNIDELYKYKGIYLFIKYSFSDLMFNKDFPPTTMLYYSEDFDTVKSTFKSSVQSKFKKKILDVVRFQRPDVYNGFISNL